MQYTKTDLTKHMTRYLPKMQDEIASFLHEEIQSSKGASMMAVLVRCLVCEMPMLTQPPQIGTPSKFMTFASLYASESIRRPLSGTNCIWILAG